MNSFSLEILAHIFEHLNYRQRVQIERVCSYWQLAGRLHAWKKVKRLKFTRKMLCLKEPWKDAREDLLRNKELYKHPRPSRSLGAFSAIIQRCGPYLTELHLQGIGVETRFGRYFRFMPHLKHLRIDKPLDTWHLQLVDKHFSSHLISLVIKVSKEKDQNLFKQIVCKSTQLECLQVGDVFQLFKQDKQSQLTPIVTSNLQYLQIADGYYRENPPEEVLYSHLLKHCPHLKFLSFAERHISRYVRENHLLLEQLMRLQLPYCNQLDSHPSLNSVKALKLGYKLDRETLQLISKNMLQLEHLELHMFDNHIKDLECLYLLQQLSSLRLVIITEGDVNGYWSLDNFYCGDENGSAILLNILSRLNETCPLRNLEFATEISFSVENVMQYLRLFTHLETFYCTIRSISSIKDVTASLHTIYYLFCEKLADILLETNSTHSAELQRRPKRVFRFQVDEYSKNEENDLVFKCDRFGNTSYYLAPCDYWRTHWRIRSVVLREIAEKAFGTRTIRFLAYLPEEDDIQLFM